MVAPGVCKGRESPSPAVGSARTRCHAFGPNTSSVTGEAGRNLAQKAFAEQIASGDDAVGLFGRHR